MMRSHPRLKAAVEDSVLAQEFIAERDSIPSGGGRDETQAEVVASAAFDVIPDYRGAFKAIEFAVYCRPDDLTNYRAFKARFG